LQTATAALILKDGRILLALRRKGKHQGPKWELPGGKVDPGEDPRQALRRELEEEFGVQAQIGECLGSTRFRERTLDLLILLFRINHLEEDLVLREHQEVRWVEPAKVEHYDLVDSDRQLLRKYRNALT
jgi:8-oxo-dGTP diphosphatase